MYLSQSSIELIVLLFLASWAGNQLDDAMAWEKPISVALLSLVAIAYFLYKIYKFVQERNGNSS